MTARTSYPGGALLTESLLKRLVANAVRKVQLGCDLTDKDLAELIACDPGTVENARNQNTKLQAHTLLNLMTVDEMAIEGLLAHFGRRSVPIEAKCSTDPLPDLSAAVHHLAVAQSPSSVSGPAISHCELLAMLPALEAAQEVLSGLIVRARKVAA